MLPKWYICFMYIPEYFELKDQEQILNFLEQHPFGSLAVNGPDGFPVVAPVPFSCEFAGEKKFLEFHVAKQNPVVEALLESGKGKFIVTGAHGYISSSVYTHVNVPTYNYETVHVSGKISELTPVELKHHLARLVDAFEKDREQPLHFGQWPESLMDSYVAEIKGYRIAIGKLEAAFKLSQNRNETDFNRIIQDLLTRTSGDRNLAETMKQHQCPIQ